MAGESARRRELAELVPDHVLVHLHRQELVAVVDAEGQADELRQDGRAARPDADDLVAARLARGIHLVEQIAVDERTLPDGTCHRSVLVAVLHRHGGAWPRHPRLRRPPQGKTWMAGLRRP